jgi:hypothetical protein
LNFLHHLPHHHHQLLDAEKSRAELKAIQKQAVMEFFERQTGKTRAPGYGGAASRGAASSVVSGTLPRTRVNHVGKMPQVSQFCKIIILFSETSM